ncbi:glycosyltransferase [Candidatus Woesearchaeota archaeon]|nr:glycosyltransferase [Candidatus Woesearchaeota archaeon]
MPDISVIIPAHNEENYLRKTLHSLENQTFQNFEIIVVTNGCTDKTEEIVKKRTDDKLRHLSLPVANVSVARNAGALNAKGDILMFLDADTTLEQDGLQNIKQQFTADYSVATILGKPDANAWQYRLVMAFKNLNLQTGIYKGCSGALLCHKEHFQKVGGYDPALSVREHRKLILKLNPLGKYQCLNTYATTSMRRYQNWGLSKVLFFWTKQFFKDHFGELKESVYEKVR